MVVIDILSKYVWLESIKYKHGIAIKNALEQIFSETTRRPKMIPTDKGIWFFNVFVKTFVADYNIKLFATHSERKAQVVERLNRSIKGIIFCSFTNKNKRRCADIPWDIASKYNLSYHRSITMAPKGISKDEETQIWINL